jgi:hypothetical protein
MADSGQLASFTFNATTYDETDCMQSSGFDDAVQEALYMCDGFNKGVATVREITFNASMAIANTDVVKLTALAPGTTASDFEYHPGGDTATYIEVSATSAYVVSRPFTTAPNAVHTIDVTIRLNDVTIQAAV